MGCDITTTCTTLPMEELAAIRTFPPPSMKLVMADTSIDPPNSEKNFKLKSYINFMNMQYK